MTDLSRLASDSVRPENQWVIQTSEIRAHLADWDHGRINGQQAIGRIAKLVHHEWSGEMLSRWADLREESEMTERVERIRVGGDALKPGDVIIQTEPDLDFSVCESGIVYLVEREKPRTPKQVELLQGEAEAILRRSWSERTARNFGPMSLDAGTVQLIRECVERASHLYDGLLNDMTRVLACEMPGGEVAACPLDLAERGGACVPCQLRFRLACEGFGEF